MNFKLRAQSTRLTPIDLHRIFPIRGGVDSKLLGLFNPQVWAQGSVDILVLSHLREKLSPEVVLEDPIRAPRYFATGTGCVGFAPWNAKRGELVCIIEHSNPDSTGLRQACTMSPDIGAGLTGRALVFGGPGIGSSKSHLSNTLELDIETLQLLTF
jgi:hypothetical protein